MRTMGANGRVRWRPRTQLTLADRVRFVDCHAWDADSVETERSLPWCALSGATRPSHLPPCDEILVVDERAAMTPGRCAEEKLVTALCRSRNT